jgi:hypothetical protein
METKKLFGYLLGAVYIIMGIFGYLKLIPESPYKEMFLVLFVVYGAWRLYRASQAQA